MLYRIVGIDPGQTTGIISFTINDDDEIGCLEHEQLDLVSTGNWLEERINEGAIVCYEIANKFQASGHISSEIIGLVKYFSKLAGAQCVAVTQSAHKRLITKDVLKRAHLDVKGDHAKDAARIALFHAVTRLNCGKSFLTQGGE